MMGICLLVLGHVLVSLLLLLQVLFFLKVVTHLRDTPCCWECCHLLVAPCCCRAMPPHCGAEPPQSSFRLPVTLFTTSSSPMMARTVWEPASTCQSLVLRFSNLFTQSNTDITCLSYHICWWITNNTGASKRQHWNFKDGMFPSPGWAPRPGPGKWAG